MLKKLLSIFCCLLFSVSLFADPAYSVDNKGNVIFEATLENLPLDAADIHGAALKYLENAYKDTRYEIVENNPQANVTGQGNISNFYCHGGLTSSALYSLNFYVRVDAKDNRARIRFVCRNYSIMNMNDAKSSTSEDFLISECSPVGEVHKKKGHKKAFEALSTFAERTLSAVSEAIKSATPAISNDDDW